MVDPLPYMTYQPFLPEVAAGSMEPRHVLVSHRRHLKKTKVITAKVTKIDHATKTATITPPVGEPFEQAYDIVVVTAGAVSRTFPIPGVADQAIGMKNIEEAIAVRDRVITNFDKAALLPPARSATACSRSSSSAADSRASRSSVSSAASPRACSRSARRSRSTTPTSTSSRRWAASCPRCRTRRASG